MFIIKLLFNAENGSRTRKSITSQDFKSCAFANFAIPADESYSLSEQIFRRHYELNFIQFISSCQPVIVYRHIKDKFSINRNIILYKYYNTSFYTCQYLFLFFIK